MLHEESTRVGSRPVAERSGGASGDIIFRVRTAAAGSCDLSREFDLSYQFLTELPSRATPRIQERGRRLRVP